MCVCVCVCVLGVKCCGACVFAVDTKIMHQLSSQHTGYNFADAQMNVDLSSAPTSDMVCEYACMLKKRKKKKGGGGSLNSYVSWLIKDGRSQINTVAATREFGLVLRRFSTDFECITYAVTLTGVREMF